MRLRRVVLALSLLAATAAPLRAQAPAAEPPPAPKFKVGDMAPDFTLPDQNGNRISLSSFRGKKNVALAFYIFAFTGG